MYSISSLLSLITIEIMRQVQGWQNLALLLLLISIFIYSAASSVYYYLLVTFQRYNAILDTVWLTSDNFCHLIITATYIKVAFETRMLIRKDTYIQSVDEIMALVDKFRCCFTTTNIFILILIVVISASVYFGARIGSPILFSLANILTIVFQFGCLLAWTLTLIRLYKDIKHSEKLLPNKRIFILHGSLLASYLFLYVLYQVIYSVYIHSENLVTILYLRGINDILISLTNFLEIMTFLLVIKLMLPVTQSEK